ncbi:glycerophosphodiester phosphodiesterase family protein [Spirosoma foliorum]|uniref:Glycerophosphodiester phosphodiesterase family protein n=1 Tax=Spirosoma foliorum TaxID=2710596 RepID=A0A7G5H5C3_9BACT|nr:glycerophosphodiester phosphodiesterase family protein [Spirosoma foliorum]QMW06315.1 glycerophosphodiester phosphodiesterase family protein [Spirosoma foliorum]
MKSRLLLPILSILLAFTHPTHLHAQPLHRLPIKTVQDLHAYFKWSDKKQPIISGHRGGMVNGFAENSLASFENTLKYTPAFFETDPRLTKDSVIVLLHDATLERMTNGTGKLSDYTWEDLKKLRLKDIQGNLTQQRIPTLEEAIEWARGKTVLNLDRKDVPPSMTAAIIRKHKATAFVMLTVHSPEQAVYYYRDNKDLMFSAFIKNKQELEAYEKAGIPASSMIAYIGPTIKPENKELYQLLNGKRIMCMISAASSYDKLPDEPERLKAYQAIIEDGASILESDYPIDVARALNLPKAAATSSTKQN